MSVVIYIIAPAVMFFAGMLVGVMLCTMEDDR